MPLFNPDILLHQAAGKAVIDTDKARGGLRSAIDDWTDLFGTYLDPGGNTKYVFNDEHTGASPGWLKEYSTMFYVADGRALVQDDSAAANFIRLNVSTGVYDTGGTKFVVDSGTAEPEYWVLTDITEVGGSGSGTDKLPKFTISGSAGSYTAVPAGYQKLNVVTQAASTVDGFTAVVVEAEDNTTLSIDNGGTLKIAGANAVSTSIVNFGGNQSLVITVPTAAVTDGSSDYVTGDHVYDFVTSNYAGDITSVTAGNGLTGGGTSGAVSLNVVGGDGITAGADEIEVAVDNVTIALSASDGSGVVQVKDFGIDTAQLAADAVIGAKIADDTIDSEHYIAGSIDEEHLNITNTAVNGYILSSNGSDAFTWVQNTASANDVEITLAGGTGIAFSSTFTTNQSQAESIDVTLAQELQDIAGLSGTGLLTYDGTNVSLDGATYLTSSDISSFITNIGVTEGTDGTTYKVLLTGAAAGGNFTGTFIDTNDLKFTPATASERGKLETGDLLVKGNLTVLGAGTDINLQRENLIVRDPNIVLGAIADSGGSITGTATGDVGITAYIDGTDDPILQYNKTNDYWEINNQDHASAPTLKIAQKFTATITAASSNVITHNLNTRDVIVQARDTNDEVVYIKYDCTSDQQTTVFFGTGTVDETIDIVIIG